jgi:hypothetical protein
VASVSAPWRSAQFELVCFVFCEKNKSLECTYFVSGP